MTIVMSEWNEDPEKWTFEGSLWFERENLHKQVDVPGVVLPVVCNDNGHCLVVIGEGSDHAAASTMALGLFPGFDLTKTYFLIAGIAGTTPNVGTVGSVAWAEWVVSSDSRAEIDRRELPEPWRFDRFRLGCEEPWCDTFGGESGFHHLNPTLSDWAFRLSKDAELLDTQEAREDRKPFPQELAASRPPSVLRCDTLSGDSYWHGRFLSEWAEWWVQKWTGGKGRYCMTNQEDFGTLTALKRLSRDGRVDWDRIMVLHAASNLDQPHPGQSGIDSLNHFDTHGPDLALENAYRAGSVVVKHIISHWVEWERGVPR
jgi:purine nucleoside permease